jgi:hypothetical protein
VEQIQQAQDWQTPVAVVVQMQVQVQVDPV